MDGRHDPVPPRRPNPVDRRSPLRARGLVDGGHVRTRSAVAARAEAAGARRELEACRADVAKRDDYDGRLEASYVKQDALRREVVSAKSLLAEANQELATLQLEAVTLRAEAEKGAAIVAASRKSTPQGRLNRMRAACAVFESNASYALVGTDRSRWLNIAYRRHDSGKDRDSSVALGFCSKFIGDDGAPVRGCEDCWSAIVTFVYGY